MKQQSLGQDVFQEDVWNSHRSNADVLRETILDNLVDQNSPRMKSDKQKAEEYKPPVVVKETPLVAETNDEKPKEQKKSFAQLDKKDYVNSPTNSNTGVLRETNLENLVKDKQALNQKSEHDIGFDPFPKIISNSEATAPSADLSTD